MNARRARWVFVLLAIGFGVPLESQQAPPGNCFDPRLAISRRYEAYERAANRYSLLKWKTENGLFDIRLCDDAPALPFQAEMAAEKESILAEAQVQSAAVAFVAANNAVRLAVADTFGSVVRGLITSLDDASTWEMNKAIGFLGRQTDKYRGMYINLQTDNASDVRQTRDSLLRVTDQLNEATRTVAYLDQVAKEAQKINPAQLPSIARLRAQAEKNVESNSKLVAGVQRDHLKSLVVQADLRRAIAAHDRVENLLTNYDKLAKAISTVSGVAKSISEDDTAETAKSALEALESLNEWCVGRLDKDVESAKKIAGDGMKNYVLQKNWSISTKPLNPKTESKLLSAIVAARANEADAESGKQLLEHIQTAQKVLTKTLPYLIEARKFYKEAGEKGFWETAEKEAMKRVKVLESIRKSREELRGTISLPSMNAISYFQGMSAAVRSLSKLPEVKVFSAILEDAADQLDLAAAVPEAFARLTKMNPAQGGRLTAGLEFQGLHEAMLTHPALAKLKAYVPADEGGMVIIPRAPGGLETKITQEEFKKVLMGLSVLTSITGKNPTQQDIYDLASGTGVSGDRPLLGPAGIVPDKFVYKVDDLMNLSNRLLIEEEAGAVARELNFINASLDFSGEQFAYTDLSDLTKRRRVSDLSIHKAQINDAFRTAYGNDVTPKVFGAIRAGTGTGPRTRENVSPLELRILEARNRRLQGPPVKVAWIKAGQINAERLEASAGIETGVLPENVQVCVQANAHYPDGSIVELKWIPNGPGGDPLTVGFALESIDWKKMSSERPLVVEVTAQAGTTRSVLNQPVKLDQPVVVEEAAAFPYTARAGTPVQLFALATLSELIGSTLQPEVTFQIQVPAGKKYSVRATDVSRWNNVAMSAEGMFVLPAEVKAGSRLEVEAVVKLNRFETSTKTWLSVVSDPEIRVGVVGAATDLKSTAMGSLTTVAFKSEALAALQKQGQTATFRLYRAMSEKGPWERKRDSATFYSSDKFGSEYNGASRIGPDSASIRDDWPPETNRAPYFYKITQVLMEDGKEKELESEVLAPSKPVIALETYGITNNQLTVKDSYAFDLNLTLRQPDQAFVYPGAHFTITSDGKTFHAWSARRDGDLDAGSDSSRRATISLPVKMGSKQFTIQAKSATGLSAAPQTLTVIGQFRDEDEKKAAAAQTVDEDPNVRSLIKRSADGPAEIARSQAAIPGIEQRYKDFHGIDYAVEKSQALANIAYFQHRIQEEIEDQRIRALPSMAIASKYAADPERALALDLQYLQKLPSIYQRKLAWEEEVHGISASVQPDRSTKEMEARKKTLAEQLQSDTLAALYSVVEDARVAGDYAADLPHRMMLIDAFKTNSSTLAGLYESLANVTAKLDGNRQQAAAFWLKAQNEAVRSYPDPQAELSSRMKGSRPAWWPESGNDIKPASLPTQSELDALKKTSSNLPSPAMPTSPSSPRTNSSAGSSSVSSGTTPSPGTAAAISQKGVEEYNRAAAFATKGDWSGAEAAYRSAVGENKARPEFWNGLGNALHAQKKYSEAEDAYRELVRLNPDNPAYKSYLAISLQSQNKFADAEASFREAIKGDASQAAYHNGLGNVLFAQGKYAEAETSYREMVRLQPANVTYQSYLGTTLQYERKLPEAEALYASIIRQDPNNADYRYQLGNVLAAQNKWQAAEEPYREAVRLDPNNALAREGVGHSLMFYQRFSDAETVYRQAIQLNPQVARFHGDLAAALLRQNRREEAMPAAREAMRLGEKQHWVLKELGLSP